MRIKIYIFNHFSVSGTDEELESTANCLWLITNSKPCPNCKSPIQKNEGCNHMKCSKVGECCISQPFCNKSNTLLCGWKFEHDEYKTINVVQRKRFVQYFLVFWSRHFRITEKYWRKVSLLLVVVSVSLINDCINV